MMTIVRKIQSKEGTDEYHFHCPGCGYSHWFRTKGPKPCWTWNGDMDKPTLSPSLLVRGKYRCHSFVKNGMIQFLNDSDHKLAGATVPLKKDHD